MKRSFNHTKNKTINWILKYVPKRTGQIQTELIHAVNVWKYTKNSVEIFLTTVKADYWNDIINTQHTMTWFEHSGKDAVAFYGGHSGYILLDDPDAIENWYVLISDFIITTFKNHAISLRNMYFGE